MKDTEAINNKPTELSDEKLSQASGGADSDLPDILKSLKDKVINASNDTNTDVDREAIQKEINASMEQIDDNALLTFNRKFLNNGNRR